MNYFSLLSNPTFFYFLLKIDKDIAKMIKDGNCVFCGGVLDVANFNRQEGFGIPASYEAEYLTRLSFCCRNEGCRKRATPPSLRFLHKKCFLSILIILISIMNHGENKSRVEKLKKNLQISNQTISRWRKWWKEDFFGSDYWKSQRGFLLQIIKAEDLPGKLFNCFKGNAAAIMIQILGLLAPYKWASSIKISQLIQGHLKDPFFTQTWCNAPQIS